MNRFCIPLLALGVAAAPGPASAALIDGYKGVFALSPAATALNEADIGTTNPSFSYSNVATYGTLSVTYGPYFTGQGYAFDPDTQPIPTETRDAAAGPLSLATADQNLSAIIEDDDDPAVPRNPVIGGSVLGSFSFVGPIAILFSVPVKALELTVGDFGEANQTILEAFAADGSSLGSLRNGIAGYQQFDLSSDIGLIAGLSLRSADGQSPTMIGVSGLGVYANGAVPPPPPVPPVAVPAPGASVLVAGLVALGWARRRRVSASGGSRS